MYLEGANRENLWFGDQIVVVMPELFKVLPEYSASLPTDVSQGKIWKRAKNTYNGRDGWLFGMYIITGETYTTIFRELIVLDETALDDSYFA